ncbi:MAG: hypothetical protein M1832_002637 [Thelocarpon impressellum]|nr:MAG: hypothetical protein M1832_002637 [Thelocarpon impressellum]
MQPFYQNGSCSPFDPPTKACEIGNYVRYAIDVGDKSHIKEGLKFSREHNIRLVLRNTGHDFNGRSTGFGSLALWTHHVKGIQYLPQFQSQGYNGTAVKVLAGDQVQDVMEVLDIKGQVALGGACPSVGVAGGYIPGGGHAPLSPAYGLAADQTLEFEVITANGREVTASPTENQDLYWALSGGGPSTYGIVWSVTVKTFEDVPVTTAILTFDIGNNTKDAFWEAVDYWHSIVPALNDAGGYAYVVYNNGHFQVWPYIAQRTSVEETQALFDPFLARLDKLGFVHNFTTSQYKTYREAYYGALPQPWTAGGYQWGSWLLPRAALTERAAETAKALRSIYKGGGYIIELTFAPSRKAHNLPNAVLPAWRTADMHYIASLPWNDSAPFEAMHADRRYITRSWLPLLKSLAPDSGAYMNEADPHDPDWKTSFFGANYARLLEVKQRWDPEGLLFAETTVGSDAWAPDGKGVLCRVAAVA